MEHVGSERDRNLPDETGGRDFVVLLVYPKSLSIIVLFYTGTFHLNW